VVVVCAAAIPLVWRNSYVLYLGALIAIYSIAISGVNILTGLCKEVSLGQSAFFAIGAYSYAIVGGSLPMNACLGLVIALLLGGLLGTLFGVFLHRLSGAQFALATVALAIIAEQILIEWKPVTRGFGGISNVTGFSINRWTAPRELHYVIVVCFAGLVYYCMSNLSKSSWGRILIALGDDTVALESLGFSRRRTLGEAMCLSGAVTALGGWLYAPLAQYVSPDSFSLQLSITFLIASLVGGRHPGGPLLGAATVVVMPEALSDFPDSRLLIYGALLIVVVYFLPGGITSLFTSATQVLPDPNVKLAAPNHSPSHPPYKAGEIAFNDVRLRFGATTALDGVSGRILRGTITCIIGPNGAGKTSLLNAITGIVPIESGSIFLDGLELPSQPYLTSRSGVARTFQTPRIFGSLTPLENVAVAIRPARSSLIFASLISTVSSSHRERQVIDHASSLLKLVGFDGDCHANTSRLPFGSLRAVELARAIACTPRVLFLDEPSSGLDTAERAALAKNIVRVRTTGITVGVITHDIDLLLAIADSVIVIDAGSLVAEGDAQSDAIRRQLGEYGNVAGNYECSKS
jgi:ABC-type branched-subunit amino acid transport system ATPase component/ABC-type branched-subunit amino acid transport system permease subunit